MAEQEVASNVAETVGEKTSAVVSNVSEKLSSGVETVKEFSGKYGIGVFLAIIISAALFFTSYLLYSYISGVLANKILWIVPETTVPILATNYSKASGDGIPTTLNGRRASFMFWVYINDISKYQGSYRHVLHRGDEDPIGASPLVMLDKTTNKLYIRFSGTTDDDTTTMKWDDIVTYMKYKKGCTSVAADKKSCATATGVDAAAAATQSTEAAKLSDEDAIKYDLATHGIIVDYVPLQRWVHITVVVNETVNRGDMYLYMDGELVKTLSSSEAEKLSDGSEVKYNFQNLNLAKKGDIFVGGSTTAAAGPGFSGLVAKVGFTNYDMNAIEVYKEYLKGPVDNLTSKLGLPAYGLRSPVYRIG
jgi:hypothetical protein